MSGGRSTAGFSIPASKTRPTPDDDDALGTEGIDPEVLESARNLIEDTLGPADLAKFDAAKTVADRAAVLQRVANVQILGKELFEATRYMDPVMFGMLLSSMSKLQAEGLHDNEAFSEGLDKALTKPVYTGDNEDGSRGPTRTALFAELSILEAELEQAKQLEWGFEARKRVQNKITRALVIAGMEASGQAIDDTADVVFKRSDGTEVRIDEDGEMTRVKS